MTTGRPDRNQELEQLVDELDENVVNEREAEGGPGKPSEQARQQPEGSPHDEPTG